MTITMLLVLHDLEANYDSIISDMRDPEVVTDQWPRVNHWCYKLTARKGSATS